MASTAAGAMLDTAPLRLGSSSSGRTTWWRGVAMVMLVDVDGRWWQRLSTASKDQRGGGDALNQRLVAVARCDDGETNRATRAAQCSGRAEGVRGDDTARQRR